MLYSYLGVGLAAVSSFFLTTLLTPTSIRFSRRIGMLDRPDGQRKRQQHAIPIAGGTVLFLTFVSVSGMGLISLERPSEQFKIWLSILIPASIVFLVGIYDDLYIASPRRRLVIQSFAAALSAVLTLTSETHIRLFGSSLLDLSLGVFWIVTLTNAFNFIDNMDGHSLSVTGIAAIAFSIVAGGNGQWFIAASAASIASSCAALLFWNWEPATVYLGDGGALFIGFMMATLALRIELTNQNKWIAASIPVIILALPLLDISVAVFGRILRGISPFQAGRDHLSHRMNALGLSTAYSVISLAGMAALAGALGILLAKAPTSLGWPLVLTFSIALVALLLSFLSRTRPQ